MAEEAETEEEEDVVVSDRASEEELEDLAEEMTVELQVTDEETDLRPMAEMVRADVVQEETMVATPRAEEMTTKEAEEVATEEEPTSTERDPEETTEEAREAAVPEEVAEAAAPDKEAKEVVTSPLKLPSEQASLNRPPLSRQPHTALCSELIYKASHSLLHPFES